VNTPRGRGIVGKFGAVERGSAPSRTRRNREVDRSAVNHAQILDRFDQISGLHEANGIT